MPIEFKVPDNLVEKLTEGGGALDSDEVWVQFLCQTGPNGEHDPEEPPDEFVRPSHAAYHGQIFRLDEAPIPPLDYGCRCAIHYVAKPGSDAAKVLEDVAPEPPTTPQDATKEWLDDNAPGWEKTLKRIAQRTSPGNAIGAVQRKARELGIAKPRAVAQMVVDVSKPAPPSRPDTLTVGGPPQPPSAPVAPAPAAPTPRPPKPASVAPAGPGGGATGPGPVLFSATLLARLRRRAKATRAERERRGSR